MVRIRKSVIAAAAAMTMAFAFTSSARASVDVGSNFSATPTTAQAIGFSITQNTAPTAASLPLTSPTSGVVVLILVKHANSGANPGIYGFRVLSGSPTTFSTNGIPAELPDFNWPANQTSGISDFHPSLGGTPKGIPISAGDRLGVVRSSGTSGEGAQIISNNSPGGSTGSASVIHNSGSASYLSMPDFELLMQYRVEPDADHDGYGDETQDQCPSSAASHGACPPAPPATKKKKCKKHKKRSVSAEVAKKKCKKRK
jgi:hypothetical protein